MSELVLVVDDEYDVCRLITYNLEMAGFSCEYATTGADALLSVGRLSPAVIVLDVGLPDISGFDICARLREDEQSSSTGIIMLTARGEPEDRVKGLSSGADDYVVKPFNVEELVLRVRALCRRINEHTQSDEGEALTLGELTITPSRREVRAGSTLLSLRPLEYKLLVTLVGEPGRVFSRKDLLSLVWEIEHGSPRTVDVHIRRLRQNLQACAEIIETVPGFGYRAREK